MAFYVTFVKKVDDQYQKPLIKLVDKIIDLNKNDATKIKIQKIEDKINFKW